LRREVIFSGLYPPSDLSLKPVGISQTSFLFFEKAKKEKHIDKNQTEKNCTKTRLPRKLPLIYQIDKSSYSSREQNDVKQKLIIQGTCHR
jgi:hypothetical protein